MASARDPIAEIVAYNLPLLVPAHRVEREHTAPGAEANLTAEALRRKLAALASSPFAFFRGTFHLMASDVLRARVRKLPPRAPDGLIVGDLHLENFGVYRGMSGTLCFDVNDFDDLGVGPVDFDLQRLCTSALLLAGVSHAVRLQAARAIAASYADAMTRIGPRFPVIPWTEEKADGRVKQLLQEGSKKTREDLCAKAAPGKGHDRLEEGDKFAHPTAAWRKKVEAAVALYGQNLHQLRAPDPTGEGWRVLDVAYRFKGLGSLGRMRFTVLLGASDGGSARRLLELKEARPSALTLARGESPGTDRGRAQTAGIRRMQGDPWPRVASSTLAHVSVLGRENEPEEEKISSDRFAAAGKKAAPAQEELLSYARQCGEVLARIHCRVNAPALIAAGWDAQAAARAAVAFAEEYAVQVQADCDAFVAAREDVARAIGLSPQS